jgi:hypothetical protein
MTSLDPVPFANCPVHLKFQKLHVVIIKLPEWQRHTGQSVKVLRSDRGTEFMNKELKGSSQLEGIVMETSTP